MVVKQKAEAPTVVIDPCPFCANGRQGVLETMESRGMVYWIFCKTCSASGPTGESELIAGELWNKRKAKT